MRVFTVHAPPTDGRGSPAQRMVFVRDGFSIWALLFPLIWFVINRMWLVLLGYLALTALVVVLSALMPRMELALTVSSFLLNVLIAFEANNLRRWSLDRKGWSFIAVATGRNQVEAEQRFFDDTELGDLDAITDAVRTPAPPPPPAWRTKAAPGAGEVTGLFPAPGR
ncbi:MAG: DUF2628 domain-containing protein [Pseudomonadota bacterium]